MRFGCLFTAAATALVIAVGGSSAALADINLPTGNCGTGPTNNCLIFDDFTVYSLAVLNAQAGFGPISNNDPYNIGTSGNDLHNVIVVATGITGTGSNNTDIITNGGVDNAYATPSAQGAGIANFQTSSSNQGAQGNTIVANSSSTWDINTADLINYLDGGKMAFFFNLNQANSANTYLTSAQDALGWLSVTLTNSTLAAQEGAAACALDVNCSRTFYLDGDACDAVFDPSSPNCDASQSYKGTQPPLSNADYANQNILPSDPNHDEWAYIHGAICMSPDGAIQHFGPCAAGDHDNTTVNQNLGASQAAFALYSDMLQYWLTHGNYDKMSVDMRMAALSNGYEQLVIFSALNIPEPMTWMMFGAGLLGLMSFAGLRRRKLKTA